jgi:hypothetical protein
MNKEEIYSIWAPDVSVWSTWAKPVLFSHLDSSPIVAINESSEPAWVANLAPKTAIVVDLPSAAGVCLGLALAKHGFRPIPLYNAIPSPRRGWEGLDPSVPNQVLAAVNVLPIMDALRSGAHILVQSHLPVDAPPVFLLDANRHGQEFSPNPGTFDNRAVCFTTDFPSANFLLSRGIERALLVQNDQFVPHEDLAHVLRRWQDGGISLLRVNVDSSLPPEPFKVLRPSWYGVMFQRVLAVLGLRRASFATGGFGAWVPVPGSGG